jgi:hypothetical protein
MRLLGPVEERDREPALSEVECGELRESKRESNKYEAECIVGSRSLSLCSERVLPAAGLTTTRFVTDAYFTGDFYVSY